MVMRLFFTKLTWFNACCINRRLLLPLLLLLFITLILSHKMVRAHKKIVRKLYWNHCDDGWPISEGRCFLNHGKLWSYGIQMSCLMGLIFHLESCYGSFFGTKIQIYSINIIYTLFCNMKHICLILTFEVNLKQFTLPHA